MENNRMLLTYGLTEVEMNNLAKENLNLKEIHSGNAGTILGEFLEGKEFPHEGEPLSNEKFIIFTGYETNEELKEVISTIRREHIFGSIMAVLTETNVKWKISYFMEHLLEEREENRQLEKERRAKA